jgi:CRP/FNR family transcriptional regulator, cyclic AMP receptor protein
MEPYVAELIGVAAAAASLYSAHAKTMVPLRVAAIVGNYLGDGFQFHARNISHIHAQRSFARIAWLATAGDAEPDPRHRRCERQRHERRLAASLYTRPKHFKADDIMMERGEYATAAFYIVSGEVEIVEIKETFGKGTLLGEIGLFTPDGRRIMTVRCKTDVQTAIIDYDQFKELYFQNPQFGFRLLHLVVERLQRSGELLRPAVPSAASL